MGSGVQGNVAIEKVEGGFIVVVNGIVQVVTSLNKAIKIARDTLGDATEVDVQA